MLRKIILCGFLLSLAISIGAHPAKANELVWDAARAVLTVRSVHPVKNGTSHYVKKIVVYVGDKVAASQDYSEQTNFEVQEMTITFEATAAPRQGQEITVISYCNIAGKKKTVLAVD